MTTYLCDEPDCVGGEVTMWDDGIVPKCWGFAGDNPHPMTRQVPDPCECCPDGSQAVGIMNGTAVCHTCSYHYK
jgi:hypothetical protein